MAKILFRILHLNKTNIFSYSKLVFEQYFRKKNIEFNLNIQKKKKQKLINFLEFKKKNKTISYRKLVFKQYFRKKVFNSIFKVYQSFLFLSKTYGKCLEKQQSIF